MTARGQTEAVPTAPSGISDLSGEDAIHHYLPIPDDIFHSGFYITSLGHSTVAPHTLYPPAQHPSLYHFGWAQGRVLPEFALNIITAGQGIFEAKETGKVAIAPEMAFLLFPGIWHRYRPDPETGWTETWMQFNGEFAHLLLKQGIISPQRAILQGEHLLRVAPRVEDLLRIVHAAPTSNTLITSLRALSILSDVVGNLPPPSMEKERIQGTDDVVLAAEEYIWSRSHHVLSVTDVAEAVGVTRRTLERHMLESTGKSVLDAIVECRYSRAERLLRETDVPIKNVATLAGFGSPQNLRHVFVKKTGYSPAEYRQLKSTSH